MVYTVVTDAPNKQPASTIKDSGQKTDGQVLRIILVGCLAPHKRKPIHGTQYFLQVILGLFGGIVAQSKTCQKWFVLTAAQYNARVTKKEQFWNVEKKNLPLSVCSSEIEEMS